MILSAEQILQLAANAGFSGPDLGTAAAVALAESYPSGNTESYFGEQQAGAAPGQGSYGLWQIYLTKHPEFDPTQLIADPQYNANAAFQVYTEAGASFRPWTTFKSGKYRSFLPQVQAAIAASSPAPGTDPTDTSGGGGNGSAPMGDLTNYWPLAVVAGLGLWILTRV